MGGTGWVVNMVPLSRGWGESQADGWVECKTRHRVEAWEVLWPQWCFQAQAHTVVREGDTSVEPFLLGARRFHVAKEGAEVFLVPCLPPVHPLPPSLWPQGL